jgi:hypothetical protein
MNCYSSTATCSTPCITAMRIGVGVLLAADSQPVRLGIGPPFGTLDQILSCSSFSSDTYFILRSKAPSLTRKWVCSLQRNHSLVRSLTPNHTLPPHRSLQLELEFFLRLTVSQPVRLGIGPPFGTLDQILSCSSFRLTITLFFVRRRPL